MHLVVVESPAKAKTIKKYLGGDFDVLASYGHVRDLIPKGGAVDPEQGFCMYYQIPDKSERHVQAISHKLISAKSLYLATDPDREGEAIAWHLRELLQERGLIKDKPVYRIAFHEITHKAVQDALSNPRGLSIDLINAQQARRALDYLVGFNLSPLLWKKVRYGLSAGRVQSPALRLIVEREHEIKGFVAREYWSVAANLLKDQQPFTAKLTLFHGNKLEQFSLTDNLSAAKAQADLWLAANGSLCVEDIERKQRKRNPAPPFTTSTLQQEAARKLGFTAQRTMRLAQQLYEGIDVGGDSVGLITYMRTDSVNLAQEAIAEIRTFIEQRYGANQVPATPRIYKTKAKNAQEAHEAVRPTSILRLSADLAEHLTKDQLKLYDLIWKRTVACQMQHAVTDTVAVDLSCTKVHRFRANGSVLIEPGFMQVYQEGQDDAAATDDGDKVLPNFVVGELVTLKAIRLEQHFTEPPPRYTEASLVKALEEYGIGRPSTYASIISTIQEREYVQLEKKRFMPTDVGDVVNKFLTAHFTQYVDYDFTARLEDDLDAVSRGESEWLPLLEHFWQGFKSKLDYTEANVSRSDVTQKAIGEVCPKCNSPLSTRLGRRGRFIGCTRYPDCDYTRDLDGGQSGSEALVIEGRVCPKCGAGLVQKRGRFGPFVGCSAYPVCRYIESIHQSQNSNITCPKCGQGHMVQRRSRRGKTFFSCSTYPQCDYAVWNPPLLKPCPQCNWPILTVRSARNGKLIQACPQKGCGFKAEYIKEDEGDGDAGTLHVPIGDVGAPHDPIGDVGTPHTPK